MTQLRGQLTNRIIKKSKKLLGYEISQAELGLMVYIQFLLTNSMNIDPNKISQEERIILLNWREKDYISGGASDLSATKEFWDIMSEIIYLGYVDLD